MERHEHITTQTAGIPGIPVLRARIAGLRLEQAARRLSRLLKANFDPNQPRVPAGNPRGGQWTRTGGGSGGNGTGSRRRVARDESDGEVLTDANPDDFTKPGTRVAQARRGGIGARIARLGDRLIGLSEDQELHLRLARGEANRAVERVAGANPDWEPRSSLYDSTFDSAIRSARNLVLEAEAHLAHLGRQSHSRVIDIYRRYNRTPNLFGVDLFDRETSVVAYGMLDGLPHFGVNSDAPPYEASDRSAAKQWLGRVIEANPGKLSTSNIGQIPNNAIYHAEATALLRMAKAKGGTLQGRKLNIYVEKAPCRSCEILLPLLSKELGHPTITFVDLRTGEESTLRNGIWD